MENMKEYNPRRFEKNNIIRRRFVKNQNMTNIL